jgi:hypothetical protein
MMKVEATIYANTIVEDNGQPVEVDWENDDGTISISICQDVPASDRAGEAYRRAVVKDDTTTRECLILSRNQLEPLIAALMGILQITAADDMEENFIRTHMLPPITNKKAKAALRILKEPDDAS